VILVFLGCLTFSQFENQHICPLFQIVVLFTSTLFHNVVNNVLCMETELVGWESEMEIKISEWLLCLMDYTELAKLEVAPACDG
jgi:hypothetical protein